MKQLLEAGVHFGHQSRKWNPKMKRYIFTVRSDIHIINLEDTSALIDSAYFFIRDMVAAGKSVLFVGTKKQAKDTIREEAERCGMYYVNSRWLGGTLTNFRTIRSRVDRMNKLANMEKVGEFGLLPKKEAAGLRAEMEHLNKNLCGIKDMTDMPGVMFVVDPKNEHIAVREARKLNIPVIGIVDTNCDPDDVDYIIPANDDAIRSIKLIVGAMADAVIEAKEGVQVRDTEAKPEEAIQMDEAIVAEPAASDKESKK